VQALVLVDNGRDAGDVEVFSLGLVHAEHLKCRACIAGINFLHVWIFSKISSSFSLWMFWILPRRETAFLSFVAEIAT